MGVASATPPTAQRRIAPAAELMAGPLAMVVLPNTPSAPLVLRLVRDLALVALAVCQLMWQAAWGAGLNAFWLLLSKTLQQASGVRSAATNAADAARAAARRAVSSSPALPRLTVATASTAARRLTFSATPKASHQRARAVSTSGNSSSFYDSSGSTGSRRQSWPGTAASAVQSSTDPLLPPQRPCHVGRLTVVLDLDETLVAPLRAPLGASPTAAAGATATPTTFTTTSAAILRPGAHEFLSRLSQSAEIVLWTAAGPAYAESQLRLLDPQGSLFSAYVCGGCAGTNGGAEGNRGATTPTGGAGRSIVKDLSRLGRDLRRTVLVDNCVKSMSSQPANGIPCLPFRGDPSDQVRSGV